jgi:hypothetical protein
VYFVQYRDKKVVGVFAFFVRRFNRMTEETLKCTSDRIVFYGNSLS